MRGKTLTGSRNQAAVLIGRRLDIHFVVEQVLRSPFAAVKARKQNLLDRLNSA